MQAHLTPLGSPDFLHHLIELHVDCILEQVLPLCHCGDPVICLESAILVCGPTRHHFHDSGISVVGTQDGPDPNQGKLHLNHEVLHIRGAHILGMRIIALRESHEENLDHILVVLLVDTLKILPVTLGNDLVGRVDRMLAQVFLQQLRLDSVGPEFVSLNGIHRPRGLFAIDLNHLVAQKIMRGGSQLLVLGNPLLHTLTESREDRPGSSQISVQSIGGKSR